MIRGTHQKKLFCGKSKCCYLRVVETVKFALNIDTGWYVGTDKKKLSSLFSSLPRPFAGTIMLLINVHILKFAFKWSVSSLLSFKAFGIQMWKYWIIQINFHISHSAKLFQELYSTQNLWISLLKWYRYLPS